MTEQEVLKQFEPLAMRYATRYHQTYGHQYDKEDLLQAARLGILEAWRKFNPSRGVKFITVATNYVNYSLKRMIQNDQGIVHLPKSAAKKHKYPSFCELSTIDSFIPAETLDSEDQIKRILLSEAIHKLPERQQQVLRAMYFDQREVRLIASDMGVAVTTVYAIHQKAILSLYDMLKTEEHALA